MRVNPKGPDGVVLLVEDEAGFRADAARALGRAGYHVVAVATTTEALDRLDDGLAIEFLIARLRMPPGHPHGIALARMVKHRQPDVHVLLHALGYDDLPPQVLENPPGSLIPRPASGADLVPALEAAIGARQPTISPAPRRAR